MAFVLRRLRRAVANPWWRGWLAAAALSIFAAQAAAVPASSLEPAYRRAAEIQKYRKDRWLLNDDVFVHWIADRDALWYERQTAQGHEYVLVDAVARRSSVLLDRARLARSLARQCADEKIDAAALPLARLEVRLQPAVAEFSACKKRWRFDIDAAKLAAIGDDREPGLLVSPDGKRAVFIKDYNLWLRELPSAKERQLTFDGERYYAYGSIPDAYLRPTVRPEALWSPDSTRLFTLQTDDRQVRELPLIDFAPDDGSVRPKAYHARTALPGDANVTTFRLLSIDVATGEQHAAHYPPLPAIRMNDTPFSGRRVWWDDDNRHAWFVEVERGERTARVVSFDTSTGKTAALFEEASDSYIELSPIVYAPATLVPLPRSDELIWYSERSGWAHLYLYDTRTGALKRQLTQGEWRVRDIVHVDEQRREAVIAISGMKAGKNPYDRQVARVSLDSGELTLLSESDADHQLNHPKDFKVVGLSYGGTDTSSIGAVSPSGRFYVETRTRADGPSRTLLLDRQGQELMTLEQSDASRLPTFWRWPQPVQLLAADGTTEIRALVFRPSDFSPHRKYPVIDHIYGGPQVANVPRQFGGNTYINSASLAELGFIVVVIDGRGTAERSRAFRDASYGRTQDASNLEDHIAGLKQLAAADASIDLERVGIYGFSGGGYMAASAMLRFPEFFKVGVAWSGNHDQRLFWHTWGERYQGLVAGDNYLPQATSSYADGLAGKLLLIHGLKDPGVHAAGVFQLTQALMDRNKDFDELLLPRAVHEMPGYPMRRMWDYFVENLAHGTAPPQFALKSAQDYAEAGPETTNVVLETTLGNITVQVDRQRAPLSANDFLKYVEQGRYNDNAGFYRAVRPDNDRGTPKIAVIQGGMLDQTAALPPVSHETTQYTGILHQDGTISLARGKPGSGGAGAFFICIGAQPSLDFGGARNPDGQGFAAFGKVVAGMDVVRKIHRLRAAAATDDAYVKGQMLTQPVKILRAYVVK